MKKTEKKVVEYTVNMVDRSEEYNISDIDYSDIVSDLNDLDLTGAVSKMAEALEELGVSDVYCDTCEQEKMYDQNENVYYCPVCG